MEQIENFSFVEIIPTLIEVAYEPDNVCTWGLWCSGYWGLPMAGTESWKRKQDKWAVGEVKSVAFIHFQGFGREQHISTFPFPFALPDPFSFVDFTEVVVLLSLFLEELFSEKPSFFALAACRRERHVVMSVATPESVSFTARAEVPERHVAGDQSGDQITRKDATVPVLCQG